MPFTPVASARRRSWAARAAAALPATAVSRRMPAAVAASPVMRKAPMSPVEATWQPPQNSTDIWSLPRVTTRTLVPYFSPNWALAPSLRASSIGSSRMVTVCLAAICALTQASISLICPAFRALGLLKSKRSSSGETLEPCCSMWLPTKRDSALCRRWVAEWWRVVSARRAVLTCALTGPGRAVPVTTSPLWMTRPSSFCTSLTWMAKASWVFRSTPMIWPTSPTWPPLSA